MASKIKHTINYTILVIYCISSIGCARATATLYEQHIEISSISNEQGISTNFSAIILKERSLDKYIDLLLVYSPKQPQENNTINYYRNDSHCIHVKEQIYGFSIYSTTPDTYKDVDRAVITEKPISYDTLKYLSKLEFKSFDINLNKEQISNDTNIDFNIYLGDSSNNHTVKDYTNNNDMLNNEHRLFFSKDKSKDNENIQHNCDIPADAVVITTKQLPVNVQTKTYFHQYDYSLFSRVTLLPFALTLDLVSVLVTPVLMVIGMTSDTLGRKAKTT